MQRIVILTPLGSEKNIYNLLQPIASLNNYEIESAEMLGGLLKVKEEFRNQSNTYCTLSAAALNQEFFKADKLIWIGSCGRKCSYEHSYALYPDIIEAEQDFIKYSGVELPSILLTTEDCEEKSSNIVHLLKVIREWVDDGTKQTATEDNTEQ